MKKVMIPVLALLLISILVACNGQGGENTYTGDFNEYNNSSSSSDNSQQVSSDSNSSIVTVPLTTQAGATVPAVETTQPTTEFHAVDYTPITPDTTKPVVNTIYVDPTGSTTDNSSLTSPNSGNNSTTEPTTETEKTTSGEVKYVSIVGNDETDLSSNGTPGNDFKLILCVKNEKLTGKVKATSGKATLNKNGEQFKVSYSVSTKRDKDDGIVVTIDASDVAINADDVLTVSMPKGAIVTEDNVSNQKFTSGQYWA